MTRCFFPDAFFEDQIYECISLLSTVWLDNYTVRHQKLHYSPTRLHTERLYTFHGRKLSVCCLRSRLNETRALRCRQRLEFLGVILKKHTRRQPLWTGYEKTIVSGKPSTCDFQYCKLVFSLHARFISAFISKLTQVDLSFGEETQYLINRTIQFHILNNNRNAKIFFLINIQNYSII